jgi:membrane protease YdiL (CAAX protease family)
MHHNPTQTSGQPLDRPFYTAMRVLLFYAISVIILISIDLVKLDKSPEATALNLLLIAALSYLLNIVFLNRDHITPAKAGIAPNRATAARLVTGLFIGLCSVILQPISLLAWGHFKLEWSAPEIQTVFVYIVIYFFAALREELVFRSYAMERLRHQFDQWVSQVVIMIIFILEHKASGMSWTASVFGSGTGALLFGFARLRTGDIALSLGIHFAWNFGQWIYGFKGSPGVLRAVVTAGYTHQADWIGYLTFLFAMAGAAIFIHISFQKQIKPNS